MINLNLFGENLIERAKALFSELEQQDEETRIDVINVLRLELHKYSPFHTEPVDCVQWIRSEDVQANDYNPNSVAPPEMQLLEHSVQEDGYTQPIVAWKREDHFEVVDGFHRTRVGKESKVVRARIKGYLPLTIINGEREDRGDRIAATIRHNRARGKHQIEAMSDIVVELKRRNWSDEKIGRELGMDPDEVLRLCQITGLAEMFANREFSEAWEAEEREAIIDETDRLNDTAEDENPVRLKPDEVESEGWSDRTESRSVLIGKFGQVLAMLNRASGQTQWRWTIYSQPIDEGLVETREEAKCLVNERLLISV
jgi:ParB-like chromosome segregation protein Spo0J